MFGLIGQNPEPGGALSTITVDNDSVSKEHATDRALAMNNEYVDSVYFNNNLRANIVLGKHLLGRVYRGNFIAKHHLFICYEQTCSILAQCIDYYDIKSITKFADLPPGNTDCIKIQTLDSNQIGSYISLNDLLSILLRESGAYNFKDTKTAMSLVQQLISAAGTFHSKMEAETQNATSPQSHTSPSKVFLSTKQSPQNILVQYYKSDEFLRLQRNKNEEAYRVMRCLIPVDICVTSLAKLRQSELPDSVCDRIFKIKALWLICMHKDDIQKIHIADLLSKYVYHGLDLVEMRAISFNLPVVDDKSPDVRKIEWRSRFDDKLYDMVGREVAGTLHDYEIRNFAYSALSTLRHDYFLPTAPLIRQAHVKCSINSNTTRNEKKILNNTSFVSTYKEGETKHLRLEHWAGDDSDNETYSDVQSFGGSEVDVADALHALEEIGDEKDSVITDNLTQKYMHGVQIRAYEVFNQKKKTRNSAEVNKSSATIDDVLTLYEDEDDEGDRCNDSFEFSLESVIETGNVRDLRRLVSIKRVDMTSTLATQLLLQVCKATTRTASQQVELAVYLINNWGANIAHVDESLCSPLHYAITNPTMGKLLITKGANFMSKNEERNSPLSLCLAKERKDCWMLPFFETYPYALSRLSEADKKELFLLLLREGFGGYAAVFFEEDLSTEHSSHRLASSDEALSIMEAFKSDFSTAPQPIETFEVLEKLILS